MHTIVIDNGAHQIKAGIAGCSQPIVMRNALMRSRSAGRRIFIGDQLDDCACADLSSLYYILPFDRGYMVHSDIQKAVWDYLFTDRLGLPGATTAPNLTNRINTSAATQTIESFADARVLLTEPYFNFRSLQTSTYEILLEDYGLSSAALVTPAEIISPTVTSSCVTILDCGFSFCHVVPCFAGRPLLDAIRRVDLGGKVLTNYLKEVMSYRYLNILSETLLAEQMKEDCCYVSPDWSASMRDVINLTSSTTHKSQTDCNKYVCNYVLPNFHTTKRGHIRPPSDGKQNSQTDTEDQSVRLVSERFCVPELLFHPSDIGFRQMGVAEALVDAVSACPVSLQPFLYANIVTVGGSTCFDGFQRRLYADVRALCPDEFEVSVRPLDGSPITYAWHCGSRLCGANSERGVELNRLFKFTSKSHWLEDGVRERFNEETEHGV